MSAVVTAKLVEIVYFLIPAGIVIAGIIFWEKNYGKKAIKDPQPPEQNPRNRIKDSN